MINYKKRIINFSIDNYDYQLPKDVYSVTGKTASAKSISAMLIVANGVLCTY